MTYIHHASPSSSPFANGLSFNFSPHVEERKTPLHLLDNDNKQSWEKIDVMRRTINNKFKATDKKITFIYKEGEKERKDIRCTLEQMKTSQREIVAAQRELRTRVTHLEATAFKRKRCCCL